MATTAQLDTGLQYARNEQYGEAVEEFTALLSQNQTCADAFFYRGCAYLHLCEYEKAINDFNSAIAAVDLSPKHELPALYKRGYAYLKINQFDSALDDYRHYINQCNIHKGPAYPIHKGLFQMGVIYAALNQYDSAILYLSRAIEDSKGTEEDKQKLYYLHRGRAYACYAQYDKAQEDLKHTLEQSEDQFIKGCAYNELGQHHDALREFDSLLQPNGNKSKLVQKSNDHILFRRGLSNASLKLHDHALSDFEYALNYSKPQGSSKITDRILFRKGMSNMALNDTHKALIDFNDSTKLNESQSDVFYARGMLHYTIGRHDAAVYDQYKAMELEQNSLPLASVYKTIYYTDKYVDGHSIHVYYGNKIHEAESLLKKNKGTLVEADIHRMIADYFQKKAYYSNDPLASYKSARGHIKAARKVSDILKDEDSIALAVNSYSRAHYLSEKYSKENAPESVIQEYIKCATESILNISNLFDKCTTDPADWRGLDKTLRKELDKSNSQRVYHFDALRIIYIKNQLQKSETIQKTMKMFADSPVQQEFYKFLVIRLCNLFDGVRMASTGIFSHSLEGTFTTVSKGFKLLGYLFEYAPIGSQYSQKVFGACESGFKKLDEERIGNTLNHMGSLATQTVFNETANAIAKELTIMYENQIKRFPTSTEETADAAATTDQQQLTACSKCANCLKRCCRCLGRQKRRLLNEIEHSTIQTIVEYGVSLSLSCLIRLEVKDIPKLENVQDVFVSGVCRPSSINFPHILGLADKIIPKDAKSKEEHWDTYDFYRRPPIIFKNKIIRAQKDTDKAKFGCRKPTVQEEQLLTTKPDELNDYGFKIIIKDENSS